MARTYKVSYYMVDPENNYNEREIRNLEGEWVDRIVHQLHIEGSEEYEWSDDLPEARENCDINDLEARFDHKTASGEVVVGGIYRHFKGHLVKVLAVSTGTEYGEKVVVYEHLGNHMFWHRPLEMFCSKVDKVKYPDVTQEYRFELVAPEPNTTV